MAAVLVGIGGGSGSGKSTLAVALARRFGEQTAVVIPHDAYYRDLAHLPLAERALVNFDQPKALDNERLIADLVLLRAGMTISRPSYDFASHTRQASPLLIEPRPLVIVEGILVLAIADLCRVFDLKVFVDASAEIRMKRRLLRDSVERGRSHSQVVAQYNRTTRPMYERWVGPSRHNAQVTVAGEGDLATCVETLAAHVDRLLAS